MQADLLHARSSPWSISAASNFAPAGMAAAGILPCAKRITLQHVHRLSTARDLHLCGRSLFNSRSSPATRTCPLPADQTHSVPPICPEAIIVVGQTSTKAATHQQTLHHSRRCCKSLKQRHMSCVDLFVLTFCARNKNKNDAVLVCWVRCEPNRLISVGTVSSACN